MTIALRPGLATALSFDVGEADTAMAVGSGSLAVLGTPRLIAWLEAATCAAVAPALEPGRTTVGTRIDVSHDAPSPVGAAVSVSATLTVVDGRLLTFDVTAASNDAVLARGEITRAVVDAERFMARLG